MRSIWKGSLGFGLVNIPVSLYSATESDTINLDMLDKKDLRKIKYKKVNEGTGEEVPHEEIVKGYMYEGDYVILDDKDFEKANAKKTKVIEISEFVNEEEIDPIYFEKPYYLEPDKGGAKPYALLREALSKTHKAGVATFVLRNKEHIAVIKALDKMILLNQVRFAEEIRKYDDLILPESSEIKPKELDMAVQLIEQYSKDFDISAYKDTYNEELMRIIEEKASGKETKVRPISSATAPTKDLMAQLKASLEQRKKVS